MAYNQQVIEIDFIGKKQPVNLMTAMVLESRIVFIDNQMVVINKQLL
jgi:hypothetical protein